MVIAKGMFRLRFGVLLVSLVCLGTAAQATDYWCDVNHGMAGYGVGTLVLNDANTYDGGTTIGNGFFDNKE